MDMKFQGRAEYSKKLDNTIEKYFNDSNSILQDFYYAIELNTEPVTCFNYIDSLCRFFRKTGIDSNEKILEVTSKEINKFFHDIKTIKDKDGTEHESSSACKRSYYFALKKFYSWLIEENKIAVNPMATVKAPKMNDKPEHIFMSQDDLLKINELAEKGIDQKYSRHDKWKERDTLIMTLFITTGMRVTALIEINVSDIDFKKKELKILDKRNKEHIYPLDTNEALMGAIEQWLVKRQKILRELNKLNTTDALIISNRGERMTRPAITYITKKYSRNAIGEACSPHKFRSSLCSTLYEETGDIEFVRDAVGHSRLETTKRYIVKEQNAKDKAGRIMSAILGKRKE